MAPCKTAAEPSTPWVCLQASSVGGRAPRVLRLINESPLHTPHYELVGGELLVTPSPSGLHQIAVVGLICVLAPYVADSRVGQVLTSPSDTELEPETLVQPDVYVVPLVEAAFEAGADGTRAAPHSGDTVSEQ
jgi:hypothetical protein